MKPPTSCEGLLPLFMCQSGNLHLHCLTLALVMVSEGKLMMAVQLLPLLGGTTLYFLISSEGNQPNCLSLPSPLLSFK